jgi:hypothetical protein
VDQKSTKTGPQTHNSKAASTTHRQRQLLKVVNKLALCKTPEGLSTREHAPPLSCCAAYHPTLLHGYPEKKTQKLVVDTHTCTATGQHNNRTENPVNHHLNLCFITSFANNSNQGGHMVMSDHMHTTPDSSTTHMHHAAQGAVDQVPAHNLTTASHTASHPTLHIHRN